ncbi:NADP-dependent fatty aldehyde dehydrogenase [Planctomycetales bacterium 10988]|nr:NADP-dependent fatty aldehyde dehydrogenase [Planctomycetales bacterium 10988]
MSTQPVLINGQWQPAQVGSEFSVINPLTGEPLPDQYPQSTWEDVDAALEAASAAAKVLRSLPGSQIADFLEAYAKQIEAQAETICRQAHLETGLPFETRLMGGEMPRTINQLRQAAQSARSESWRMATIEGSANIRSCYEALGPVLVMGPNNFPLAFGAISGGDFAAAIAAGNPVIGKAHELHPGTHRLFAEAALTALEETDLPTATVQLLYSLPKEDGLRLVADPRLGATGYTGSRQAGEKLKAAADAAGKPIYLEMSSINPVVILPGALEEQLEEIADAFTTSCLMAAGQFCTNPGLVFLLKGTQSDAFVNAITTRFQDAPVGTLFSAAGCEHLQKQLDLLQTAGAELLTGGKPKSERQFENSLLKVSGQTFLANAEALQAEAFGNASLIVEAESPIELVNLLSTLEGNLTGCFYSHSQGEDDTLYDQLAPVLRSKVGRLLNDQMPTGVAVSAAMQHGGPYPSTGHPGFTAVGFPSTMLRFAQLACYDQVRQHRLPPVLQDKNPTGETWRRINGSWSQRDVS